MNYGAALRTIRMYNGMTIQDAAETLKVSYPSVATKESQSSLITKRDLLKYIEAYGVSLEDLEKLANELDDSYTGEKVELKKYDILTRAELQKRVSEFAYLLGCSVNDILENAGVTKNLLRGNKESKVRIDSFKKLANFLGVPVKDFVNPAISVYEMARKYNVQQIESEEGQEVSPIQMYCKKLQDPRDDKVYRLQQLADIFQAYRNAKDIEVDDTKDIVEMLVAAQKRD